MKNKFALLMVVAFAAAVWAGQPGVINFVWTPSAQTNAGYYFYYGTGTTNLGTNVTAKVNVGTNTAYSLTNLAAGPYWAQSSAHDPVYTNIESVATNLIKFVVPAPPGTLSIQ
jgi:steroid 5-alpha reductase family enzyme